MGKLFLPRHGHTHTRGPGGTDPIQPLEVVLLCLVTDPNGDPVDVSPGEGHLYCLVSDDMDGMELVDADASVSTAGGSTTSIQLRRERAGAFDDMLSTTITIDSGVKTSYASATEAEVDTANDDVATGDFVWVYVEAAGSGAKGLDVAITFQLPQQITPE